MKSATALFLQFFILGCTSFGGPAAHIGYFRKKFVDEKKWLKDEEYGQLIALSQFLPGPGSSQVGFAIGLKRHGLLGGILAFTGFTLPSFLIMLLLAIGLLQVASHGFTDYLFHSFKLLAVIVVLDATLGMAKSFCQEKLTQLLAIATACFILLSPMAFSQIIAIAACGLISLWFLKAQSNEVSPTDTNTASASFSSMDLIKSFFFIGLFVICLLGLTPLGQIFNDSFVAGSLVFGGGHVVLPLLQEYFAVSVGQSEFITGYAAAQAIPGPMFTFATYLGAMSHEAPILGATLATLGIFLPGFLLVLIFFKHWQAVSQKPKVKALVMGINASVVGLLAATLYNPVFTGAVESTLDLVYVVIGFSLIRIFNLKILWLIALFIAQAASHYLLAI